MSLSCLLQQAVMATTLHGFDKHDVRGSYSARVPRSFLAEVHREFVHHIVEEEVDGREERQDDRRDRQREENGEVEENQTHNMSAWI